MKERILITGSSGKLGSDILRFVGGKTDKEVIGLSHAHLDITDKQQVKDAIKRYSPDVIINCAALTDLDYCEDRPEETHKVNVIGTKNLADYSPESYLIQISSDYVIDPVNEYTRSKLLSEAPVLKSKGLVIRTTYYNERHWVIKGLMERKEIKALTTHLFNPASSLFLADSIIRFIEKKVKGTVNIGTKNKISFYDFAGLVKEKLGIKENLVKPIERIGWKRAKRPDDVFLDTKETERIGIKIPTIEEDLDNFVRHLNKRV